MQDAGAAEIRVLRRLEAEGATWASALSFSEETLLMGLRTRGFVDGYRGHGTWDLTPAGREFLSQLPTLDLQDGADLPNM